MLGYVRGQFPVGKIDVVVCADMHDNRNFNCGHNKRYNSSHGAHVAAARYKNCYFSTSVREQSIRENATRRSTRKHVLCRQSGSQFSKSTLIPRQCIFDIDNLRNRR